MRIGLFGGTFDPLHIGHLISAEVLADELGLDRVIFIPSGRPPHKPDKVITSSEHRYNMLELGIKDNSKFEIDKFELDKAEPCYTINTVKYFLRKYAEHKLYWLIGSDSLAELPSWYCFDELIELIDIISAYRGGFERERVLAELRESVNERQYEKLSQGLIRTPMIEISASEIRKRVKNGISIKYFVPESIEEYIIQNGLYL